MFQYNSMSVVLAANTVRKRWLRMLSLISAKAVPWLSGSRALGGGAGKDAPSSCQPADRGRSVLPWGNLGPFCHRLIP